MIQPATLHFSPDGVPFSPAFDDVYHSTDGGIGQAEHVFLAGNDLPARWRGREEFTLLETGFGLGLNFLVTWQRWRDDPARSQRLHFVSVEKFPLLPADLLRLHGAWPQFAGLSAMLLAQWPPLQSGRHELQFDQGRVRLTLLWGDALTEFPQLTLAADAIYLDGFSPAKNPDMWSLPLFAELYRLTVPGGTLATWSVAGRVRSALQAAGFVVRKQAGFGGKRQMLAGCRP